MAKDGQRVWRCRCTCGKEIDVRAGALRSGRTQSCGCKKSKNNRKIEKFLQEKKIHYKAEYFFDDLYISNPKGKLKFDFAIFNNNKLIGLIEYQGIQHFQPVNFFGGQEGFEQQQIRDIKKKEYCQNHNIKLYYINYNEDTLDRMEVIINELFSQ